MKRAIMVLLLCGLLILVVVDCRGSNHKDHGSNGSDDDSADDDLADDDSLGYVPLLDDQGRTLIIHGANYMGLESGGDYHKLEDYQRMASWGFNVVRVPIGWSRFEPEQGVWDESYLTDVIAPVVGFAHKAGIRIILDLHQYNWCSDYGGEGIPNWICDKFADLPYPINFLMGSGDFWNHPEYLDDFVEFWNRISKYFAGEPAIFAYDLFNEPIAGAKTLPWLGENVALRPLYVRAIDAIRANDAAPYIMIEPIVINVAGFPFVMDPIKADKLIYSPHLYPNNIVNRQSGYDFPEELIQRFMEKWLYESNTFGAPLFVGETGIQSAKYGAERFNENTTRLFDQFFSGWAWWAYGFDDDSMGLLDSQGREKDVFMNYLIRPYPQATAGALRGFSFDVDKAVFSMSFDTISGMDPSVEIYVPTERHYTGGFTIECTDPEGSWSSEYDQDTGMLHVACDPGTASHAITIIKKEARD